MVTLMVPESDLLEGCELDFTLDPASDEEVELLPLFPTGEAEIAASWQKLFSDSKVLREIAPRSAQVYERASRGKYGGSGYDIWLADRLRALGLRVVEVDGWKTAGSSNFTPRGSVNHHTAGPLRGNAPSLKVCINGRSDLPGPLCNVFLARDNTVYVVAAGRANHAGRGGWGSLAGNSSVYGLEWENVGTDAEPVRADQVETMALIHVAFVQGYGGADSTNVCQHHEWTTRKIDAWRVDGNIFRSIVNKKMGQSAWTPLPPVTTPPEELDMAAVDELLKYLRHNDARPQAYRDRKDKKVYIVSAGDRTKWHVDRETLSVLYYTGQVRPDGTYEGDKFIFTGQPGEVASEFLAQFTTIPAPKST